MSLITCLSGRKRYVWDKIYDDDGGSGSVGGIHPIHSTLNMFRDTSAIALL
jgi:hypothetical protein